MGRKKIKSPKVLQIPTIPKKISLQQTTQLLPGIDIPDSHMSFFSLPPPPILTNKSKIIDYIKYFFLSSHQQIQYLNNSKIFAGLIVIILNIAGKFVNFKLSKTMESYMKHTFSRNILVFCIAWMGSREIYVAILITILCILLMDFVCNENSGYCILPETFITHHNNLIDNNKPSKEEINNAKSILQRAQEED